MADPLTLIERLIVNQIIKKASDFTSAEFHLLYGVKDEVERLKSKLSAIQATLRDAERGSSQADSNLLQDSLMKLREAALDAGDVLETYATRAALRKIQKKRNPISTALELHEAAEQIKKITTRIAEISVEWENFRRSLSQRDDREEAWVGTREDGPLPDASKMYGREDEKSSIITWLTSKESNVEGAVPVLPITGMAGLGKTTLAQFIYNDERVKDHFKNRIWIDARRVFNLQRVGREIVEFVTVEKLKVEIWSSVVERIVELLKGMKFLLVLDDLWEAKFTEWGQFHELMKEGEKGSRILITSRTKEIVQTVQARNPLYLDYLQEEECWSLFAKIAFHPSGLPSTTEIETIGRKIVHKCDGLPLAVRAMAHLLYSCNDVRKWKNIEKAGIWEAQKQIAQNGEFTILPALKLSYDHLPAHLKQCFRYCNIFPKGHMFDKNELIKLWMAEGYVDSSGQTKLDQLGGVYFDVLWSRSFFHQLKIDKRERYRIHDLFHDLAASVSGKFTFQIKDDSPCIPVSDLAHSRHVSFLCKDVQKATSESILKSTKLRTILLPVKHNRSFGEVLDKIFCTLTYLRVLDLSSTTMTELPKSVGKLILLRYLNLSHTEIRELPDSICKLINLQTLKLLGCCWLYKLPKGFNNLTDLWHLELDEMFWNKCTYLPPGIGILTKLHNMHFFRVGHESVYGVGQLQSMNSLTGKLHISNLENTDTASAACLKEKEWVEELVLEWSDRSINQQDPSVQETVLEDLEPHSSLRVLQICRYVGNRLPAWMAKANASIENLTQVSLSSCVDIKILSLGPLPHVREFRLKGMQNLEEWPDMQYPTLYRLQISRCPKLKTLPSFFPNLRVMKIKTCDVLEDLPVTQRLSVVILIDNLMLENWKSLPIEVSNADGEIRRGYLLSYTNLLELQIKNCQRLRGLPTYFWPKKLEISGCPLIRALPNQEHSQRLQHLALDRCNDGTLVEAIPTTSSAYSLVISNIEKLNFLPASIRLSGLKTLYIHHCGDLESLSDDGALLSGFTSLLLLSVCGCPKLTIFANTLLPSSLGYLIIKNCLNLQSLGPQNFLAGLIALRDLQMEDCPQIRCFPEGGLPSSLKRLCIQRCPLLSQSFTDEGSYDQLRAQIADLEIDST